MRCAVYGCDSDNQVKGFAHDVSFFTFPKDKKMIQEWIRFSRRKDKFNVVNARICSKHFTADDYVRNLRHELLGYTSKNCRSLKEDAVPSKNLPQVSKRAVDDSGTARDERKKKRQKKELVETIFQKEVGACSNSFCGGEVAGDGSGEDSTNNSQHDLIPVAMKNIGASTDFEIDTEKDELIASLKKRIEFLEKKQSIIGKIFSDEQLKKLEGCKVRLRWTAEDISKSIVIYSAGPRAYRLLLKKGYPFPAVSTLRGWLRKLKMSTGILKQVFNIMKSTDMSRHEKICVLSFDEMKIRKAYLYDKVYDETLKPYNYAQVVMLRGLFRSWKQPVFYNYDFALTKEKLLDIIDYAESSGFRVVAVVSDLGDGSKSLHNELNVNHQRTWFINPSNNKKIHIFADVPHLIKLMRNNFLDHGFIIKEKEIGKNIIEELLDVTGKSDLTIAHKISRHNLNVKGAARQKVKLATKLFSHTVAMAISRCGSTGALNQPNWLECSEFFKLVNDWFDVLNVGHYMTDSRQRTMAYGQALEIQDNILFQMTKTMENLRVKGKKSLLPFQKGIIMTNNSVQALFKDLKSEFSCEYILTYRLNQDVLEHFFGAISAKGGLHDHPDALEFRYRLRSYLLGRNEGSLSRFGNVEEYSTGNIFTGEVNLCGKYFSSVDKPGCNEKESLGGLELNYVEYDGLENLAGYICHAVKEPTASIASTSSQNYTWVSHLSEGGLTKPSPEIMTHMESLEKIFKSVNGDTLCIRKKYLQNLLDLSSHIPCSDKAKQLFFRSRMFFRIKQLNRDLDDPNQSTIKKKDSNKYS